MHLQGQKSYSKQTVYDAHLKSDKHKKREKEGTSQTESSHPDTSTPAHASSSSSRDKTKVPARVTFLASALLLHQPIPQLLADSRGEVERRMALTAREREAELEEAEEAPPPPPEINTTGEEEEEDEDGKIYNPLKLPLGWDGKPIPYWLYKLHGLGVSFSCEICSEASYQGACISV
jgi:splicing factor 3A subunit 3